MIATVSIPEESIAFPFVRGPVVYFLMLGDECMYMGSTCNLAARIGTHQATMSKCPELSFDGVQYIHVERSKMIETERYWQEQLKPRYIMCGGRSSGFMIRLPEMYRDLIRQVQQKTGRSITQVVQTALRNYGFA